MTRDEVGADPRGGDGADAIPAPSIPVLAHPPAPGPADAGEAFARYVSLTMPPGAMAALFEPLLRVLASPASRARRATSPCAREAGARTLPFATLRPAALLFAGDHAVASQKAVSAFPCEVTSQMVVNFLHGGAAMAVLARRRGMSLDVCDVGVAFPLPGGAPAPGPTRAGVVFHNWNVPRHTTGTRPYPHGAADISEEDALALEDHLVAFGRGRALARERIRGGANLIVLGEMGIGNTTPATAISAALLGEDAGALTGVGTGLNVLARRHKTDVVRRAVTRFRHALPRVAAAFAQGGARPEDAHLLLSSLGGFELSALAGAACGAMEEGCHVLLDGVIATAAVAPFVVAEASRRGWLIAGHRSAEPAHTKLLGLLGLSPLVDLHLRLGEGSGAAVACGLLQDAMALLEEMATFADAGVAGG